MENKIAQTENKTIRGTPNKSDLSEIFAIHGETKYYAGWHFGKELKDIKLDAEQSLVDALTRFHKRRLEGQKKTLRAFSQPNARRNKFVTRQPFNDTQSTKT